MGNVTFRYPQNPMERITDGAFDKNLGKEFILKAPDGREGKGRLVRAHIDGKWFELTFSITNPLQ